ncbi:MAG: PIG-L family deacetylase [Nitrospiraceae bacterium]|nr:PIG-L family deacetylase [Nitrospiraceae bacterium]
MTSTYFNESGPSSMNIEPPKRVMAIGAHPDDIEFGAGGTIAKWAQQGCEAVIVIMTDGSKGTWNPEADPLELAMRRQGEARRAAGTMAPGAVVEFLGWTDGELRHGERAVAQLCHLIRQYKPDVLIAHDPWKRYRLHPDHRAAGFITTDALVAARDPHFLPELGMPHRPSALLLFEADEANHLETLGELALRAKVEALLCHRSQHESSMEINDAGNLEEIARFRQTVRDAAERNGGADGAEFAEAFHLISEV